ncbi:hypothetical protein BP6252_06341 [Coleophoma cylindrospora]|uniref:PAS domain-containing protein n=1 Tax=Coleophoma cylindrospora TaxID=1849047 RepID=A0A3D8RMC5_9HELO|nr:hypothetical protein BP6252_06341 [Coleophoma cylindrospora]
MFRHQGNAFHEHDRARGTGANSMRQEITTQSSSATAQFSQMTVTKSKIAFSRFPFAPKPMAVPVALGAFNPATTNHYAPPYSAIGPFPTMQHAEHRPAPADDPAPRGSNEQYGNYNGQFHDSLRIIGANGVIRSTLGDFTSDRLWNGDSVQEVLDALPFFFFKSILTRDYPFVLCDERGPKENQVDNDWPIVYSSPGWTSMMGYTAEEVLGKDPNLLKCCDPDQNGALVSAASEQDKARINANMNLAFQYAPQIVSYNTRHAMGWHKRLKDRCQIHGYQINFTKDGTIFNNELVLIPIVWNRGDREGRDRSNSDEEAEPSDDDDSDHFTTSYFPPRNSPGYDLMDVVPLVNPSPPTSPVIGVGEYHPDDYRYWIGLPERKDQENPTLQTIINSSASVLSQIPQAAPQFVPPPIPQQPPLGHQHYFQLPHYYPPYHPPS